MIPLSFVALPLEPAAGPERVGELRDDEDAFAAEFLACLHAQAGRQTEVVLLDRNFPAGTVDGVPKIQAMAIHSKLEFIMHGRLPVAGNIADGARLLVYY